MKNFLLIFPTLFLLGAASINAYGQDYQVFYNLYNDSISYVKKGKPVKSLRLRKGDEVRVHLTEYNPFVSDVALQVKETTDDSGSGLTGMAGFASLLPGIPGIGGFMNPDGESGGMLPMLSLDLPVLTVNDSAITLKSILSKFRGAEQISKADQTMREIEFLLQDISSVHNQLIANERALQVSNIALLNVEPLRTQANIRPSLVKKMCREYYDAIFQKDADEDVSLNDLLAWQKLPAEHQLFIEKLKGKQNELNIKIGMLEAFSRDLTANNVDDENYQKFTRDMIDFQIKSRGVKEQLKEVTSRSIQTSNIPSNQEMAKLQLQLAEVISNDFTYHTTIQPTADEVSLDIKLMRKQAEGDEAEPEILKERNLRMEVRGGLKVKASAGVSFGQFFEPGQSYSVSNGVIVGDNDGVFTPSITSFLHFHGYRGQKATLGGSFGAGIPLLGGGDEGQSVEFYVGPSMMFGTNQRLVLSFGLKGGRVHRLGKGYSVGDQFDANLGDIPTKGKYEMGLFLGASFNLGM